MKSEKTIKVRDLIAIMGTISAILALGVGLTAYAHTHFSTKIEVEQLRRIIERVDDRVYELHNYIIGE